ncbi:MULTISPECIES: P1 family peptidase [Catenuloplanes]|uniref:L-aminopeptidase/D-esterase-like protein n=1 Tax=Catenuloplanes niger TaxID=587534 RepID=A0AAE3ZUN6_9ACTN|nr:P1 family peptidase [Catenuloplanes niger]MDR7325434.1 L-aminopeptidase/D-esterase-like protein [Catenuloplanes niger]
MTVVEVPAGVRVGHWTGDGTGVTVILPPPGTVGSGEVRGGAPATREFELLSPERMVDRVDAVVLSGGSAFGLAAGDGVMRALRARDEGFPTAYGPVPIVIGMSVFDASVATTPPDATAGRAALRHALDTPPAPAPVAGGDAMPGDAGGAATAAIRVGRVGAGTGAMSGRWLGRQDPGGFGAASARDVSGAVVTAFAVVNALGVIIAPDGSPLLTAPPNDETPPTGTPRPPSDAAPTDNPPPAPGTTPTGDPRPPSDAAPTDNPPPAPGTTPTGDPRRPSGDGAGGGATRAPTGGVTRPFGASSGRENTTLVVVVTDAKLTKGECLLLAQSGHDGMARALHPAHTRFDGDAVVALATGSAVPAGDNDLDTIRATAITVVATAIRTAVPRPGPAV